MADSQQKIDWTAVRHAALDCLGATWDLICWAVWSQDGDYDADRSCFPPGGDRQGVRNLRAG